MKLSELAANLAQNAADTLNASLTSETAVTAEPLLTNKAIAPYGRKLEPGTIAIRVLIVANEELGELGRMELFIPVSKAALKLEGNQQNVFASVMRFIMAATQYRADMLAQARERMTA